MSRSAPLSASMEDYLEAIYHIVAEKQAARAKDIAQRLKVNNSSVTGALRALSEKGLINYAPYDVITLTAEGKPLAEEIVRKHEALKDFFITILHISQEEAEKAACGMEHTVSPNILDRLMRFTEFLEICPRGGVNWIDDFWENVAKGCDRREPYEDCRRCIQDCLRGFDAKKAMIDASQGETLLRDLPRGQRCKLLKIKGRSDLNRKLKAIGAVRGSIFEVEDITSPDRVMDVKVKGYHISLRQDEASKIVVESLG